MTSVADIRSLSLLSWTLASRLTLSFHLTRHATSDGKTPVKVLRVSSMMKNDINVRMLNSMSVPSLCLVAHVFQKRYYPVAEVALDDDLSVLRISSDTAFYLQCTAEVCKIIGSTYESCNQSSLFASATFSVDGDNQILLFWRESCRLLVAFFFVGEIGICREDYSQSFFPVIVCPGCKIYFCKDSDYICIFVGLNTLYKYE